MSDERARLEEVYAAMADGELQAIASDSHSLTDLAQHALDQEMARRNLIAGEAKAEKVGEVEFRNLVTIRQFRDLPEAILAKGMLDSAEIESFLADDNIVRMDWFISNLVGGVKLKVRPEDVEAANLVLEQPMPEELNEPDET